MVDCPTRLAEAKAALHALQTGELIASCTMVDGRVNQYTPANVKNLQKYIGKLEAECGTSVDASGKNPARRGCVRFYG